MATAFISTGKAVAVETGESNQPVSYKELEIQATEINKDLVIGMPTVDIGIYLGETEGQPHPYVTTPDELKTSFEQAKEIFVEAGVQLRLLFVKQALVSAAWLTLQANQVTGVAVSPKINAYIGYRAAYWKLTDEAKHTFEGIIQEHVDNHQTIYLLYLTEVQMAYFDRSDPADPQIKSIPTGGLSLPAYLFEARIPRLIRGVITICYRNETGGRLMPTS